MFGFSAHPRESGDPVLSRAKCLNADRYPGRAFGLQRPKHWVPAFAGMSGYIGVPS